MGGMMPAMVLATVRLAVSCQAEWEVFMRNRVGPYVVDQDFFDRVDELDTLVRLLEQGDHISLVAQRRIGKTSLLYEVARRTSGRLLCLYVDLQSSSDASDALVAIAAATREHTTLWTRVQGAFANVLSGVESIGGDELKLQLRHGLVGDWRSKGDRILADVASSELPAVLMLDEIPVLLVKMLRDRDGRPRPDGHKEAELFLSWLRRAALAHAGRLRVLVTGSIGLGPVAQQVGLSGTLNIYRPVHLPPWSPSVAMDALVALASAASIVVAPDACEEVVERLGSCIPYHVQLFFSQIEEDARRRRATNVSRLDVQRVYTTRMLAGHAHPELAHMEERLRWMVPHEAHALAIDLLSEAALVGFLTVESAQRLARDLLPEGASTDPILQELFAMLEHDGYLERGPDGHRRFVSKLLRDWWKARHGEFFVPASRREVQ